MKILKTLALFAAALFVASCSKDGETIYINDDLVPDGRPIVFFLSKKGSLGDQGYVDAIYRGVVKATNQSNMLLSQVELPTDTSTIDYAVDYVLGYMKEHAEGRKALVVVANDNLEKLLHHYAQEIEATNEVDFLLAESNDTTLPVHTMHISQYGVYYQAGKVVCAGFENAKNVMIVSANPNEKGIAEMRAGFVQAVEDENTKLKDGEEKMVVENTFLSQTDGGYNMADSTYKMSYTLDHLYDVVLPLCGGSAQGFFRYNREVPTSFSTIGVDSDMQQYSSCVPFSVVKHIDQVVQDWVVKWGAGETMPKHVEYGLSSGYTEIVVANKYKNTLSTVPMQFYNEAIEKEKNYENK